MKSHDFASLRLVLHRNPNRHPCYFQLQQHLMERQLIWNATLAGPVFATLRQTHAAVGIDTKGGGWTKTGSASVAFKSAVFLHQEP